MASSMIEVTCPRCGHKWSVDVEELKASQATLRTFYREVNPRPKVASYRVQCPQDGTWVVVDVEQVDDE